MAEVRSMQVTIAHAPKPASVPMVSTMRRLGRLLFAALMMASFAACERTLQHAPLPHGSTVLALGDSLVAGYGLAAEQAWPAVLAADTGWNVVNAGVSGDTSAQGLGRLDALLEEHRPAAVLLLLGGNDMLRRVPAAETTANLAAAIARVRAHGAHVLLVAVPRPTLAGAAFRSLDDADFYAEVAREQQAPLLAGTLAEVLSQPQYKLDQLHPNAAGQRELARGFAHQLRGLGLLKP